MPPTASYARMFRFWLPLASTWLMMSVEGPFLAAIIARLSEPKVNLAAYGVSFAVAILVEAPVIMMLSASTALVADGDSYRRVRRFAYGLNGLLTAFMILMLVTPLWMTVARSLIGLPQEVALLTWKALLILAPWPAAIGYRRFFQGLLIRHGMPRRVAYGTVVRLVVMAASALYLAFFSTLPGVLVAAAALSAGVVCEAVASRFMASAIVHQLRAGPARAGSGTSLSTRNIARFYLPLAMTSTISMAAHPVMTFFMGRAPAPLESLAVLPVVNSLVFVFRALGLAVQEVSIALLAENSANRGVVARFSVVLALCASGLLSLIAFTPLAELWFVSVSGLTAELAHFALLPLQILALMPALSVILSMERAFLVHYRRTDPISYATAVELLGIIALLTLLTAGLQINGAVAAALAFMGGRLAGNLVLLRPVLNGRDVS